MRLKISISATKVASFLAFIVILLIFMSLAGQFSKYYLGYDRLLGLINILNVDNEGSIATWYSSVALLFASILLAMIASAKIKSGASHFIYWAVLSIVFLFLSLDEAIGIHERVNHLLYAIKFYHFTWIVPAAVFSFIFGLSYMKFLFELPPKTRYLFLFAGTIFLTGSIGMEAVAIVYADLGYDLRSMAYAVISNVEEFLEMIGIVIFIYTLIDYMSSYAAKEINLYMEN